MHRSHHWKQSLRSLVLPSLLLGLTTGCGAGGELAQETPGPLLTLPSPLSSAPTPHRVVLEPEADTYVWANSAGTNYGTSTVLAVDTSNTQTYLRFNLLGLPAGARIASVMLQAVANNGWAYGGDGSVHTYLVPDDTWSETGIHWNNKPAISGGELGSWWVRYDVDKYAVQMGINSSPKLVAPVQQALETDGLISLRLSSPGFLTRYYSRDYTNTGVHWPTLLVYYYLPV